MRSRENDARELEERLSSNLREEADTLRRLEHQVELARRDLAAGATCCRCQTPLDVHDQFSREVRRHLLRRKEEEEEGEAARRRRRRKEQEEREEEEAEQDVGRKKARGGGILKRNAASKQL